MILEIILYIIYEIIVSKKIKIEEPYSKSVIFIWRESEIILHIYNGNINLPNQRKSNKIESKPLTNLQAMLFISQT